MERIEIAGTGAQTTLDAAHIVRPGESWQRVITLAVIAEPEARARHAREWDEEAFRAAVRALIAEWDTEPGDVIQWDQGRDRCEEETI